MSKLKLLVVLIIPLMFLLIGLKTIPDYGVNWDEAQHFNRGHAYLYYFITGKTNYLDLGKHHYLDEEIDFKDIRGKYSPLYLEVDRNETPTNYRRSYYQSDVYNFEYFKKNDSGHPPLNGILAAFTNYVFYQKLGILGDLYSHHLFEVVVSFGIVLGVGLFVFYLYGLIPSIVASSSLSLYPLFLAESHFNIKDPVLAAFYGLTIICFFFGITNKNLKLLINSAVLLGLSLGTKFNTLFLIFILLPWLLFYFITVRKFKVSKKEILILLSLPLIPLIIFILTWPYLWFNGSDGLNNIFNYYADEGTGTPEALKNYTYLGFNFFPIFWIVVTTPIPILLLSLVGIVVLFTDLIRKKSHISLLILLWVLVPILRVTLPNTAIYGGVRHIMEFIPALAICAGIGAFYLIKITKGFKRLTILVMAMGLLFVLVEMIKTHPNQNVYFNQLIGGLSGAKQSAIPYWGNSFGNAYQQGIVWLNKNAEVNAKVGLPIGGTVNLVRENLRRDLDLSNSHFSAFEAQGEYQMEMSHDWSPERFFSYDYLNTFLNPVYEVKVDGVAILKVWKNDFVYKKKGFNEEKNYQIERSFVDNNELVIDISQQIKLTRVYINYEKENCQKLEGVIMISRDGLNWETMQEPLNYRQMSAEKLNIQNDFFYLFAAKTAKSVKIVTDSPNSCILKNPEITIMGLANF